MFWLHRWYSILAMVGVTKKLTQEYVGSFLIKERIGRLAYKLDIPLDWKIPPVLLIAQLQPAPTSSKDPF